MVDKSPLHTDAARDLLQRRYFTDKHLILDGVDNVEQEIDENGHLVAIRFPERYAAQEEKFDAIATLHEMGHFVTLAPKRIVREGFGFGGGIPEFGNRPWSRIYTKAVSHLPEAQAFAWEYILTQDLFSVDIPLREHVESLAYAADFYSYPGLTKDERLDWVEALTAQYVDEYRKGTSFDELWAARVAMLPELIAAENARIDVLNTEPVSSSDPIEVFDSWTGRVDRHELDGLVMWRAVFEDSNDGEMTYRDFESEASAMKWIERTIIAYSDEPENESTAPGM